MEDRHQLVRLLVAQLVAPRVLDKGKLAVDALADRGGGGLGEDEARHVLQLGAAGAIRVPPQVGGILLRTRHHPRACKRALLGAVEGDLRINLLAELGDLGLIGGGIRRKLVVRGQVGRFVVDEGDACLPLRLVDGEALAHLVQDRDPLDHIEEALGDLLVLRLLVLVELGIEHVGGRREVRVPVGPALLVLLKA
eukprot:5440360-Prymnesium_polylepis.1